MFDNSRQSRPFRAARRRWEPGIWLKPSLRGYQVVLPGGSDGDEVDVDPGGFGKGTRVAGVGREDAIAVGGQAHHGGIAASDWLQASSIPARQPRTSSTAVTSVPVHQHHPGGILTAPRGTRPDACPRSLKVSRRWSCSLKG